jgi:hypothetical protein
MSGQSLSNLAKGLDMSGMTGDFGGKIDFDDLYFINDYFVLWHGLSRNGVKCLCIWF